MKEQNIKTVVLIGMPGSGKSTCAKSLAKYWDAHCLDSDSIIEKTFNQSITEIFAKQGEPFFRALEQAFVIHLANTLTQSQIDSPKSFDQKSMSPLTSYLDRETEAIKKKKNASLILSTGGGLPVHFDNLNLLMSFARVIYLHTKPEILAKRLSEDYSRPLLKAHESKISEEPIKEKVNRLDRITSLLSERESLYRMAHCTIDTSFQSHDEVVNVIIQKLNEWKSNEDFQKTV